MLLLSALLFADSASASHSITITIPKIVLFQEYEDWEIVSQEPAVHGGTLATMSRPYGVTVVAYNTALYAMLSEQLPAGVILTAQMFTTIGTSTGEVLLSPNFSSDLVLISGSGNEYNTVELYLDLPADIELEGFSLENLILGIEERL